MNEHFVNVKVDREERPDVDALYMDAVRAHRHGRLADDGLPHARRRAFLGGTYFPTEPRHGAELPAGAEAVSEPTVRARRVATQAPALVEPWPRRRRSRPRGRSPRACSASPRARARASMRTGRVRAGRRSSRSLTLEFLLRLHLRGDEDALPMVVDARRDGRGRHVRLVGGGFTAAPSTGDGSCRISRRCSTTTRFWRRTMHVWVVTGDDGYRGDCRGLARLPSSGARLAGRRLRLLAGRRHRRGRGADLHIDAPTRVCKIDHAAPVRARAFRHPRRLTDEERGRLFELREGRPKPDRDDKAIAAWNGLALAALAEAGRRLERADYLDAARALGEFLLGPLSTPKAGSPDVPRGAA